MSKPSISFEFFPPKSEQAAQVMWEAVPKLARMDPQFMTVTYGAGGSTRDKTLDVAMSMQQKPVCRLLRI